MRYKNKTDRVLVLPNIGVVAPNGEIESNVVIENPNIEPVSNPNQQPALAGAENNEETE